MTPPPLRPLDELDEFFEYALRDAAPPGMPQLAPEIVRWRQWWRGQATDGSLIATTQQLLAAGVTRSAQRHAVRTGRWTDAGRGAVARVDVRDDDPYLQARREHAIRAAAAAVRNPEFAVAGRSAATLHGLRLRHEATDVGLLRRGRQRKGPTATRRVSSGAVADAEVADWFGAAVTTVPRTLVDLARHDAQDGIVAADWALHAALVTRGEVTAALERAAGWPGIRRAREVLELADAQAESPLESLVRLILHDARFPPPQLQYEVGPFRADLAWPDLRLVLEADGLGKYDPSDPAQLRRRRDERGREKRREQYFRRAGLQTERVTWIEATAGRDEFVRYFRGVVELRRDELARRSR